MARKTEAGVPAEEKMVTFVPAETFTGWPLDDYATNRAGVIFTKNIESVPVPESYAALIRAKGLVADQSSEMVADTTAEAPAA